MFSLSTSCEVFKKSSKKPFYKILSDWRTGVQASCGNQSIFQIKWLKYVKNPPTPRSELKLSASFKKTIENCDDPIYRGMSVK